MNSLNVKNSVKNLGISPSVKGYTYLCRAVQLVCANREYYCRSADGLYKAIARENNTHSHCIERDIRTAIRNSRCSASVKKLIFMIAETLSNEEIWE